MGPIHRLQKSSNHRQNSMATTTNKLHLAFLPLPSMGHLTPTLTFAHHLLRHQPNATITILLVPPASASPPISSLISSSSPHISFHHLPRLLTTVSPTPSPSPSLYLHLHRPFLLPALRSLLPLHALVLDLFAAPLLDLPRLLGIPAFVFFPSSAALLSLLLHLPSISIPHPDHTITLPGFSSPVPVSVLPSPLLDHDPSFLHISRSLLESTGIILNTFAELEPLAMEALEEYDDAPPVYPVGPLLPTGPSERHECIRWLDGQPRGSVVYVCFGSRESRWLEEAREIGEGLERSGHRFLWVTAGKENRGELPSEGERGKGKVWRGWAPQGEVLRHVAVGGFITHCGWNSALEGVWNGVAMWAWPMGAEQRMNAVELAEEVGVAVGVGAGDVERAVRMVMGDGSAGTRERARAMRAKARAAVAAGGSSTVAMEKLLRALLVGGPSNNNSTS